MWRHFTIHKPFLKGSYRIPEIRFRQFVLPFALNVSFQVVQTPFEVYFDSPDLNGHHVILQVSDLFHDAT